MSVSSGSMKRQQTMYVPQDIYIQNNKVWHAGTLAKSEFAPSSHVGAGGTEHAAVTTTVNGFMTAADKIKLNAMSDGANKVTSSSINGNIKIDGTETTVYTHPSGDGNLHVPTTTTANNGKVLMAGSTAGSLSWTQLQFSNILSTSTITDTQHGARGGDTLHAAVTQSTNGFMISTDKAKLDNIQSNAINQSTADGRYLQLTGGTLSADLTISNINSARLILNADTDNDVNEAGEPVLVLTQDGGTIGAEIKLVQGGTQDNTLMLAPYVDYNTATPTKNYTVFIHDKKIWHEGTLAKSEFTPASHVGTGGTSHAAVTTSANGFMIYTDKSKLDGIATNAMKVTSSTTNGNIVITNSAGTATETIVYTHPTTAGNIHLPSGGVNGQYIKYSGTSGTGSWATIDMGEIGTGTLSDTQHGSRSGGTLHALVTTTVSGFMDFNDKVKLNGVSTGANKVTTSSTNGNIQIDAVESTVYVHPTTSGNKHIPSGGASGNALKWSSDGTAAWGSVDWSELTNKPTSTVANIDDAVSKKHNQNTDTGTSNVTFTIGSSTDASATPLGLQWGNNSVIMPYVRWSSTEFQLYKDWNSGTSDVWADVKASRFFKSDGTEVSYTGHTHTYSSLTSIPSTFNPPIATSSILGGVKQGTNINIAADGTISGAYATATQSANGLFSSSDKTKLDGVSTGANKTSASLTNGHINIDGADTTVYTHPSGDGNLHVPATSTTSNAKVLKAGSTAGSISWASVDWTELTSKPSTYTPPIATASALGGIIVGTGINVATDGTITHPTGDGNLHVPATSTTNNTKVLKAGSTAGSISWSNVDWTEIINKPSTYTPPIATASILGGVKIGSGINVDASGTITHPTGDGNIHVPTTGTTNTNKVLKATATAGAPTWGSVDWGELTGKPSTFTPSAHTHAIADVTNLSTSLSDKASLSSANTFTYNGAAIKIQPSTAAAANAVLLQVTNSTGANLITMGAGTTEATAKVVINGDLQVTGTTTQSNTQNINGDMNVTGNLSVTGNATLGDSLTDQTTVKGDLRLEGNFLPIGRYLEVGRMPVFGIADDFQFETDSTTFQDMISHFSTFDTTGGSIWDAPQTGGTRYYRLLVSYASNGVDNSTIRIVQEGTTTEVISFVLPAVNGTLGPNSGLDSKARAWKSAPFTTTYTGSTTFQAQKNVSGNLAIRYIEVIAYDYFG